VLGDELSRLRKALRRRHRGRQGVDHAVVEADEGEVRLGNRQVLVIPVIRDDRLALLRRRAARAARQVEAVLRGETLERNRLPHRDTPPPPAAISLPIFLRFASPS
jgi:hypothetical protein